MRRLILIAALLIAGCAAQAVVNRPDPGIASASQGVGGLGADLATAGGVLNQLIPMVSPEGRALIAAGQRAVDDGTKQASIVTQGLTDAQNQQASALAAAEKRRLDEEKILNDKVLKANQQTAAAQANGRSWLVRSLYGITLLALLAAVGCWIAYEQTSFPALERIAVGMVALIVASLTLIAVATVMDKLTPVFVYSIGGIVGVSAICACVIISIEAFKRGKAIIAQSATSTGKKDPTVPLPASVSKVISNLLGPAAAAAVTPRPITIAGKSDPAAGTANQLFIQTAAQATGIADH